ncbi:Methyltransf-25 domain-containing protein [Mycena chlorophos]|uniref:Methyltransf-25 domain-containing protein n=1 Tax=Mycena chlorophos TaxID=658473 RepID=A0A8H6WGK7_MYCCL|nr:Methyltransf-25 domain-containing protein [Mycena chlorophos]
MPRVLRADHNMSDPNPAERLASLSGYGPQVGVAQPAYRLQIVAKWPIAEGLRVLELGCGQGDMTTVLADAVGANGHVDAVDPGALDYGSPQTLGQAQARISAGPLGSRIRWIQATPLEFLAANPDAHWDVVVLVHSLWYFSSSSQILETLRAVGPRANKVCIAEWSLSGANAETHVLAALTQAALECHKPIGLSESNVRTVVSPARIKELAAETGLKVVEETKITPGEKIYDGRWEAQAVVRPEFVQEVDQFVANKRERGALYAMRDAFLSSLERVGGTGAVRAMDAWLCVFAGSE